MPNYIDWYLVELDLRLRKHLPAEQVQTILGEAESHLRLLTEARIEADHHSTDQAMLAAIEAFGSPEKIALDHLRESDPRFFGVRPIWAVLGFGLLALLSWNFAWLTMRGPFDHFGETWQNGIAGFVCLLATVLFALSCRAGHKSFAWPILALGGSTSAVLVVLFSWWIVGGSDYEQGVSRFHMSRDTENIRKVMTRLDGLQSYAREGMEVFERARSGAEIPRRFSEEREAYKVLELGNTSVYPVAYERGGSSFDGQFLIPHRIIYPMVDGRIWALEFAKDLNSAKIAWRENAPSALSSIESSRARFERLESAIGETQNGRLFFYHRTLVWPVINQTLALTLFLTIVGGFVWLLGRRRGHWPARALA